MVLFHPLGKRVRVKGGKDVPKPFIGQCGTVIHEYEVGKESALLVQLDGWEGENWFYPKELDAE